MKTPPLVSPGPALTVDEVRRYSRHLIIPDVAMAGQQRMMNAKVLCVGAGGLGSPALMYLAAAGIGTLGIVEFDTVDESNLQRQIIHGQSDIGKSKAQSAKEKISKKYGANSFGDLPEDRHDPLWKNVMKDCRLSVIELSAAKNERCKIRLGYIC